MGPVNNEELRCSEREKVRVKINEGTVRTDISPVEAS